MTTFLLAALGVAVLGLVLVVAWLLRRPTAPAAAAPAWEEALRHVLTRVEDLRAQFGRDSGIQQSVLQQGVASTQAALQELQRLKGEREADRRLMVEKLAVVETELRKVSGVLAGRESGKAGENILREALRLFPQEMIRSPLQIGGNDVEFGLVLYDRRVIPIDSKFAATEWLEQLEQAPESEKPRHLKMIEDRVLRRASEIAKYLDPTVTTPFAICAVPDSVHRVLRGAHTRAYQEYNILVMAYSTAIPVLLAIYQMHLKSIGQLDEARVEACLKAIETQVVAIRKNLENRVKDAQVQLGNAYQECMQALGAIEGSIASTKASRLEAVGTEEPV